MKSGTQRFGFGNFTAEGALSAYANGVRGHIVQGVCPGGLAKRSVAYPNWGYQGGFKTENDANIRAGWFNTKGVINNY